MSARFWDWIANATGTLSVTCNFVTSIGNIIVLPNIASRANIGTSAESCPYWCV